MRGTGKSRTARIQGHKRRHPGVVDRPAPADLHAVRGGGQLLDQAGLADSGRPADEDDVTRARARVGEPVPQERQFLAPADQRVPPRRHTGSIAAPQDPVQVQYPVPYQH